MPLLLMIKKKKKQQDILYYETIVAHATIKHIDHIIILNKILCKPNRVQKHQTHPKLKKKKNDNKKKIKTNKSLKS